MLRNYFLNQNKNNSSFYYLFTFILLVGLIISALIHYSIDSNMKEKEHLNIVHSFDRKVHLIKKELELNFYILKSLKSFHKSSEYISRKEFKRYVDNFLESPDYKGLHGISWVPKIKDEYKDEYEMKLSKELDYDFKIKQKDEDGKLIPVRKKEHYFSVDYIEPYEKNKKAQGFDISSNEARLKTLNQAKLDNKVTITSKIKLVQETGEQFGFLGVLPVWDKKNELLGYYSAVFRIDDIINTAFKDSMYDDINIWIADITNENNLDFLYSNNDIKKINITDIQQTIEVAGRKWLITAKAKHSHNEKFDLDLADLVLFFNLVVILTILIILYYINKQKILNNSISKLNDDLNENLKQLKYVNQLAKLGSWQLDLDQNKLIWSEEIYTIFEIDNKELFKLSYDFFINCIHPEDRKDVDNAYLNHLKDKKPYEIEHRLLLNNDKIKWVLERCETTFDNNGKPVLLKGIVQDITEKKEAEIKDKEQQITILNQSRLVQLGEMISMIAHQWRQPLNALSIWKYNLISEIHNDNIDYTSVNMISSNMDVLIKNLSETIDDFRNFYKDDKELRLISLKNTIEQSVQLYKNKLDLNNIEIKEYLDTDIQIKSIDSQIRQIMLALISNAKDALIESNKENKTLSISLYKEDNNAVIEVKDNANGIPIEIQNKIFDPYFSTKKDKNGTGMGMYMIKMLLNQSLNGSIDFTSDETGTAFFIKLPI